MAEATIPVDLRNPGQVFACLGLMEGAEVLCGPCKGGFGYTAAETATAFTLAVQGEADPVESVLSFIFKAELVSITPIATIEDNSLSSTATSREPVSICRAPKGDTLPLALVIDGRQLLQITSWADRDTNRDNLKFWGGAAGFSGAGRFAAQRDAALVATTVEAVTADPFSFALTSKTAFSLDGRSGGSALDAGFSSDKHDSIKALRFPLVEMLAVIGLENARPERLSRTLYRYGVSSYLIGPTLFRAILSGVEPGFDIRHFEFSMTEPNDYARLINSVYEISGGQST